MLRSIAIEKSTPPLQNIRGKQNRRDLRWKSAKLRKHGLRHAKRFKFDIGLAFEQQRVSTKLIGLMNANEFLTRTRSLAKTVLHRAALRQRAMCYILICRQNALAFLELLRPT